MTLRSVAAVLLAAALSLVAPAAHAAPATLSVSVSPPGSEVVVQGTLATSDGKALRKEKVTFTLDGTALGSVETRGNGGFRVALPTAGMAAGAHSVTVSFAGSRAAEATQVSVGFTIPGAAPPAKQTTAAPPDQQTTSAAAPPPAASAAVDPPSRSAPPPPPATPKAELTVKGPTTAAENGDRLSLTGTLTSGGKGIGGAGITVRDDDGDGDDSYAITNNNGGFSTTYEVPENHPNGTVTLTLTFDGEGVFEPASDSSG